MSASRSEPTDRKNASASSSRAPDRPISPRSPWMIASSRAQSVALPSGRRSHPVRKCCDRQVGTPACDLEDQAGTIVVRRDGRGRVLGGPQVLGDGGVLLADPAEQVAGRLVLAELAIELDRAIDRAGGLEGLGGRGRVVELLQVEDRRIAVQAAALQGLGGHAIVAQELAVDVRRATEVALPDGLLGGLAIFAGQLVHQVRPGTPDSDRLAAFRPPDEVHEVVDRATPRQPIAPPDLPVPRVGRCHREGMPQGPRRIALAELMRAASGPARSGRPNPTGPSRRSAERPAPARPISPRSEARSLPAGPTGRPPAELDLGRIPLRPRRASPSSARSVPASPAPGLLDAALSPAGGVPARTRGRAPPGGTSGTSRPISTTRSASRRGSGKGRQARRGRGRTLTSRPRSIVASAIEPEDATARQEDQPPVAHQAGRLVVQQGRDELGVDGQVEVAGQRSEADRARDRLGRAADRASSRKPPATSWTRPDGSRPSRVQTASSAATSRVGTNRAGRRPAVARRRSWNATWTVMGSPLLRVRPTAAPRRSARRRRASARPRSAGSTPDTSRPASRRRTRSPTRRTCRSSSPSRPSTAR